MSKDTAALFTSETDEWATPQDFFNRLDRGCGGFTLDPCATAGNAKCKKFYTLRDNGLAQDWAGELVWMNPPYGRAIGEWVEKAYRTNQKDGTTILGLVPARTDTRWWHEFILGAARAVRFVRGRLTFGDAENPATFPSAVVVWGPGVLNYPMEVTVMGSESAKVRDAGQEGLFNG